MNVGRYLRGEDLHVGTSRITKPKELKVNERIQELLKQATIIEVISGRGFDTTQYIERFDEEKFTKLIVQECVKVMYDNAIERKVPLDINYTPTHYAVAILEHFGVEE